MNNENQIEKALDALEQRKINEQRKTIECEYNTKIEKHLKNKKPVDIDDELAKTLCKIIATIVFWLGCWKLVDLICDFVSLLCMFSNN